MKYKILQWGAGVNGSSLIRAVARHADTELVGCRVWSDSKSGMDAGVIAGIDPIGVIASNDRQAMIDLDADVAIVCPRLGPDPTENDRDIIDLLRSGKNVICVAGSHTRPSAIPGYGEQFEDACRVGNSTLAAAGINPGFIAERLAPTLTGICTDVTAVEIAESYDCSVSNPGVFFETMGFAKKLEDWTHESPSGALFDRIFTQSIYALADALGVVLTGVRHECAVAPAPWDLTAKAGTVPKGRVAAISQAWTGTTEDPDDIKLVKSVNWVCGKDIPGHPVRPGWRVTITGKPTVTTDLEIDGGEEGRYLPDQNVGGAISVIPEVVAAPPGFLRPVIFAPFRRNFARSSPGLRHEAPPIK